MPSVNVVWTGSSTDRATQLALTARLTALAQIVSCDLESTPAFAVYDAPLDGKILVGASVLAGDPERCGLERVPDFTPARVGPIQLNVISAARAREISEDIYVVAEAALVGTELRLFDPRRLYPDDSRLSFVFVRSACPALDGQVVLVETARECRRYESTPVASADWYLTRPRIHLRYFAERWMDLLLAWVKRFYVPDLAWWRHDDMTGWEEFVVLTRDVEAEPARDAAFESLKALFRDELARWTQLPPRGVEVCTLLDATVTDVTVRQRMASYLAADQR